MFVINRNLKIKELSTLLNNEAVEVDLNEALINVLSNSMKFLKTHERPSQDEIELNLALTIRCISNNDIITYGKDKSLSRISPVLRNPFNKDMQGYFLFMYTLQHMLGNEFVYPIKSIVDTVLYPTRLVHLDNKLILTFTLFVPEELLPKYIFKGIQSIEVLNEASFTNLSDLDKIILASQKIVNMEDKKCKED